MPVSAGGAPASSPLSARVRRLARWTGRGLLGVVGALLVVNSAIIGMHSIAAAQSSAAPPVEIDGIPNLRVVDDHVWRGKAPHGDAYDGLAAAGVTAIVDLRAERDLDVPTDHLADLGVEYHSLPIRDGQTPSEAAIAAFRGIVEAQGDDGLVYVHCGAGVGRAGSMSAAYLISTGQESPQGALARNLEVGPPSIEQIWFATQMDDADDADVPRPVKAISRFFDGPRRIWSVLRG